MQFYGIINCYLLKYIKSSRLSSRPDKAGPRKQPCKNTSDIWRLIFSGVATKENNCAEHEYVNMPPSLIELATPLLILSQTRCQVLTHHHQAKIFYLHDPYDEHNNDSNINISSTSFFCFRISLLQH